MAANTHLSIASWNLALNAGLDVLNGGFLEIYDGAQPATPDGLPPLVMAQCGNVEPHRATPFQDGNSFLKFIRPVVDVRLDHVWSTVLAASANAAIVIPVISATGFSV